jgi:hypothetical protein
VTVWEVLGLPELDTSNPETPQGIIAPHLKRAKAELMKLSRKFSSKETVMQSLEAFFKANRDIPPTLRIPLPRSMRSAEFSKSSAVSFIELLELLKKTKIRLYKQLWTHDLTNGRSLRITSLGLQTFLPVVMLSLLPLLESLSVRVHYWRV